MQTIKLWNSLTLHCKKIAIAIICLFSVHSSFAQEEGFNMMDHDERNFYFGIAAGINNSQYRISHSSFFTKYDSVLSTTPTWSAGFQVGISATYKLSKHFAIRFTPQFVLTQKNIDYTFSNQRDTTITIESILLHNPLQLKFSSDRIKNFKFYVIAGGKMDYDFNSNTRSKRNDEVLFIKPVDFGYELGVGFEFYYPNFMFCPELKISNGVSNVQKLKQGLITSEVFDRINTRTIYLGFIIGG